MPLDEPYPLTAAHIVDYDCDGFLILPDFFTAAEHHSLVSWCDEVREWGERPGAWMQYHEVNVQTGERQLCRSENFTPYHEGLKEVVRSPRLMGVLARLRGEECVLFKEKINYKLSGGGGFPPHQDAPAYTQFGQSTHITAMLTVDATSPANGCLYVVPGSHRNEYERRVLPQEKDGSIDRAWCEDNEWQAVECEERSILVFGAYLAHRSGPNTTPSQRRAVYLTYNAAREGDRRDQYYKEKRRLFPPMSEREEGKDYSEGATVYNLATPIVG